MSIPAFVYSSPETENSIYRIFGRQLLIHFATPRPLDLTGLLPARNF